MEAPVKIVNSSEHLTIQPAKFTSVVGNMYLMHLLRQFFLPWWIAYKQNMFLIAFVIIMNINIHEQFYRNI